MLGSILPALLLTGWASLLAAQDDLPDGKGKETLENTCTECHGLDKVLAKLRTERQWRDIAVQMRSKGATMTDDELKTLVEYLSQNFGAVEAPKSTSTRRPPRRWKSLWSSGRAIAQPLSGTAKRMALLTSGGI